MQYYSLSSLVGTQPVRMNDEGNQIVYFTLSVKIIGKLMVIYFNTPHWMQYGAMVGLGLRQGVWKVSLSMIIALVEIYFHKWLLKINCYEKEEEKVFLVWFLIIFPVCVNEWVFFFIQNTPEKHQKITGNSWKCLIVCGQSLPHVTCSFCGRAKITHQV